MATAVIMPRQGQSVESCILTELKVKKGDTVAPGDILFAYETDKAAFEEEARIAGEVLEVFFAEGDEVPVLTGVMVIGAPGEVGTPTADLATQNITTNDTETCDSATEELPVTAATQTRAKVDVFEAAPVVGVASWSTGSEVAVSPRAKTLADRHCINTGRLTGSGPDGRVIERDVRTAVENSPRTTPLAKVMIHEGLSVPAAGSGPGGMVRSGDLVPGAGTTTRNTTDCTEESTIVPLSNMRKLIARAMHASLANSAQLTHHLGADARRLLELRMEAKAAGKDTTINDLVCWSIVRALEKFPSVNAHFLGEKEGIRRFAGVHLAVAVDTDRGLMVPVVRNADAMSLDQLSASLKEVAAACKKGAINPDLLASEAASFTVSNLGNYGVEMFTPIVNLPQVAIMGVNTIVPRPKDLGSGVYGFVPHIGLSLTYDHRAIDGGEATRFLKQTAIEIENLRV